jgi:hypothetical protein
MRQAKLNALKTQCFQWGTPGKKAMPREIFPEQFTCRVNSIQNAFKNLP